METKYSSEGVLMERVPTLFSDLQIGQALKWQGNVYVKIRKSKPIADCEEFNAVRVMDGTTKLFQDSYHVTPIQFTIDLEKIEV